MDGQTIFSVTEPLLQTTASKHQRPQSENVPGWIPTCVLSDISRWLTILIDQKTMPPDWCASKNLSLILTQNWNIGHKFLIIPLNGCQVWLFWGRVVCLTYINCLENTNERLQFIFTYISFWLLGNCVNPVENCEILLKYSDAPESIQGLWKAPLWSSSLTVCYNRGLNTAHTHIIFNLRTAGNICRECVHVYLYGTLNSDGGVVVDVDECCSLASLTLMWMVSLLKTCVRWWETGCVVTAVSQTSDELQHIFSGCTSLLTQGSVGSSCKRNVRFKDFLNKDHISLCKTIHFIIITCFFPLLKPTNQVLKKITWGCGGFKLAPLINALFTSFH